MTTTPSSVIVLGSINTDLVVRSERLPQPGETVIGGEFYQAAGGKGANQAVAAARAAKTPVTFIGAVGDDTNGRESLARLRSENLNCDYLKVVAGEASGVALILVDAQGQNLISVASGANARLTPQDIEAIPENVFQSARVFLACLETPLDTIACGLRRARRTGLLTILNPAPASREILSAGLLPWVDILTPNAGEAAGLAGIEVDHREAEEAPLALRAARALQAQGCGEVIVTLGARGCLVVGQETQAVSGRTVRAVDATAAGDAFCGALAVALAEGRALLDAVAWANAAAALSVTRRGAQPSLAARSEIDRFVAAD
ncbi:MAG: ribokinase [Planctomycetes bacterium]|nr:ribokinase [Planctomycetota bacterium]